MNGNAEHARERLRVPIGGPELELRVAARPQADAQGVVAGREPHVLHDLGMAAIEPLGQAKQRAERLDGAPLGSAVEDVISALRPRAWWRQLPSRAAGAAGSAS